MPQWTITSLTILLCVAIVTIIVLVNKLKDSREEFELLKQKFWQLRVFLGNFCPAETVGKVLAEQAVKVKASCSAQAQMQQGSWAPTPGIDPHDEEARHKAFRAEYDRVSDNISKEKSAFWGLHNVALLAAEVTGREKKYFGLDDKKASWKHFLPGYEIPPDPLPPCF